MAAGDLITADGQIEWAGLLMGAGTPYRYRSLTGWYDLPEARRDTEPRPGRHGHFAGELRSGERIVELGFTISPRASLGAVADLRRVTAWRSNPVEEPLVVRLDGVSTMVNARVLRRSVPTDRQYAVGYTAGAVQWAASDPLRYGLQLRTESTGLPTPAASGLAFPLAFPLDFGPAGAGGSMQVFNDGDADAWPVWEITGPVTGPIITNLDTGQRLVFDQDFTLAAGQLLTIDTDARTVQLSGVSRSNELTIREWFTVPAGGSARIGFTASNYDAGARLSGFVRDTYL